jgi:cadmium resistance protein CadD (predicted permease)
VYFGVIITLIPNMFIKVLLGIVPALLGAVMVWACVQRVREIKEGEEDDLGKY